MERVFKIKTKTNTNPRFQYPSERRYSASVVLGFSIVFLQIFVYSVILGTLIIHKMVIHEQALCTNETSMEDANTTSFQRLNERVEKDLENSGIDYYSYINLPAMVCAGSYFMALGCLLSFVTGLFSLEAMLLDSCICFVCTYVSIDDLQYFLWPRRRNERLGTMWSVLSTYIGYWGMKNCYPDDMVLSKAGRNIEVSTVRKGRCPIYAQKILVRVPRFLLQSKA
ncbi:hypothetical protein NQ317_014634 [Molorchus minor]|uniref:Odorant receptor n=1 Tax=Molorchus minor TaxID=1323400 RepID=A0ABQ9JPG0_9CUCU|nr:hypothetical protein NQ317_014634 [Molorchus minor]